MDDEQAARQYTPENFVKYPELAKDFLATWNMMSFGMTQRYEGLDDKALANKATHLYTYLDRSLNEANEAREIGHLH